MINQRAIVRELLLVTLFVSFAIAYTWPLAKHADTAVTDPGDPVLNTWILDWVLYQLPRNPLQLFDAPMFAGARHSLAFSENLIGIALLMFPFKWAGLSPLSIYNVAIISGMAVSGYGASVLARTAGASLFASIVAGVSFAFSPFFLYRLPHLQIIWAGWLPLSIAALLHLMRSPRWRNALLLGGALLMAALTNIHWLLFGWSATAAACIFMLAADRTLRTRAVIVRTATAFAAAGIAMIPVLLPYRAVSQEYGMARNWEEIAYHSAHLIDYFRAMSRSAIHGSLGMTNEPERNLAFGVLPILLALAVLFLAPRRSSVPGEASRPPSTALLHLLDAAAAVLGVLALLGWRAADAGTDFTRVRAAITPLVLMLLVLLARWWIRIPAIVSGARTTGLGERIVRSRFWPESWLAFLLIVIGVTGSLGVNSILHPFLFHNIPLYRATRVPARWGVIAFVGFAILAARGIDLLMARRDRWRPAIVALVCALTLVDTMPRIQWVHVDTKPVPVYEWLATRPVSGPVFELPMQGDGLPFAYLLGLAHHRLPLINGTSGFGPPWDGYLHQLTERNEFNDVLLAQLRKLRTQIIVVHADLLGDRSKPTLDWLASAMDGGQLVLLRRFDRGPKGDFVFGVSGTTGWQHLRDDGRDRAGFTVRENFDRIRER